jgi:uncharacterized protein (DUF433 family)
MATITSHIELRSNRAGSLRAFISGTRVRVQDVYALAEIQGRTPDQIVGSLPELTLGQVHAALSYYFDHRQEILDEIRDDDVLVGKARAATGPGPLEAKLSTPDARP